MGNKETKARTLIGELEDPEISIAAMSDILFVLLTFFMSVTSMDVLRTKMEVPLPEAANAQKANHREAVLNVLWTPGRGGEIWFADRKYESPEMLSPLLTRERYTSACIRCARDTQYAYVSRLTKTIADAGIPNTVFATTATK